MIRAFNSYVPLMEFRYAGNDFEIFPSVTIKRITETPKLYGIEKRVSKDEWEDVLSAKYWLTYEWKDGDQHSTSEMMNLALLSLWLVQPSRITASLRFDVGEDGAEGEQSRIRLLDRFAWNH